MREKHKVFSILIYSPSSLSGHKPGVKFMKIREVMVGVMKERKSLRSSAFKTRKSPQDESPDMQSKMTKKVNKTHNLLQNINKSHG